jgi:hypothetical protein
MADLDLERFRLRRLVEQLAELDEVEVHDEPVALADLSTVIEASGKAVLFRKAGPEQLGGRDGGWPSPWASRRKTAWPSTSAGWPVRRLISRCRRRTRRCTRWC